MGTDCPYLWADQRIISITDGCWKKNNTGLPVRQ